MVTKYLAAHMLRCARPAATFDRASGIAHGRDSVALAIGAGLAPRRVSSIAQLADIPEEERVSGSQKHNGKRRDERRGMDPDAIDRVVRKYDAGLGLDRGYSAHSMRATFITTALENGAQLEDVQKAAGDRDPSTTKLYDRRGYNPENAASFFATY